VKNPDHWPSTPRAAQYAGLGLAFIEFTLIFKDSELALKNEVMTISFE
jgi:hypothetical protein